MKPLLERKRRARINKCLDDIKDLMVAALQSEGESITKLEKADVLELTVRHLQVCNIVTIQNMICKCLKIIFSFLNLYKILVYIH